MYLNIVQISSYISFMLVILYIENNIIGIIEIITRFSYNYSEKYRALFIYSVIIYIFHNMEIYSMKITSTALLVFAAMSLIVVNPLTLGSVYALKDEDGRYLIVTIENVKSRDIELTGYIYDEDEDTKNQRQSWAY